MTLHESIFLSSHLTRQETDHRVSRSHLLPSTELCCSEVRGHVSHDPRLAHGHYPWMSQDGAALPWTVPSVSPWRHRPHSSHPALISIRLPGEPSRWAAAW
ncbi:hypothetical protein NHX12_002718 [Muraenolepis orangiensis]|uniref:Uncharacterized protein n=1 Tax=Muraenolepis orangiensis TaxID=630683 RepID=A0A9Q0DXK3_9TELE|nr:hypothetical protein NHX12_002718 [Muraenolepis orangiensis]